MSADQDSLKLIKKALDKRYLIKDLIGSGGMAEVYRAVQQTLDREVAIKIVHQNLVHDKEFIGRFIKEARVAAALNHPNIITIHDVDSVGTVHYMTMELLNGEALNQRIRKKGKLGVIEMLKIIIPIAQALNYLHKRGFVHRDVKSSNILITADGRPVLTDFGIVYTSESMLSQPGTVLGTPEFMSPEQASGNKLDARSDLYSLGVIMYECITGQMPFRTDNPLTTVYKVINEAPIEPIAHNPSIPIWLNTQILNLLSKDPAIRVRSGNLLANNLLQKKEVEFSFAVPTKQYEPIKEPSHPKTEKFHLDQFQNLDDDFIDPETRRMSLPTDVNDLKTQVRRQKAKNSYQKGLVLGVGIFSIFVICAIFYLGWLNERKRSELAQLKPEQKELIDSLNINDTINFVEPILTNTKNNSSPNYIYTIVDQHPQFPGGVIAFNNYIKDNLRFPPQARNKVTDDKVLVSLIVEKDGGISNVAVMKSLGFGCDEEAIRLISSMPNFSPGVKNGENVRVKLVFPITFRSPG
jgi:serine/threonine protein kinase